jgi:hypothetical protein
MWCFSWVRRAALRVSSEGLRSERARMTSASRKDLNVAIRGGIG